MYCTTIGTGPFKPVVVFDDLRFVLDVSYEKETEAFKAALPVYQQMVSAARIALANHGFKQR